MKDISGPQPGSAPNFGSGQAGETLAAKTAQKGISIMLQQEMARKSEVELTLAEVMARVTRIKSQWSEAEREQRAALGAQRRDTLATILSEVMAEPLAPHGSMIQHPADGHSCLSPQLWSRHEEDLEDVYQCLFGDDENETCRPMPQAAAGSGVTTYPHLEFTNPRSESPTLLAIA